MISIESQSALSIDRWLPEVQTTAENSAQLKTSARQTVQFDKALPTNDQSKFSNFLNFTMQ